MRKTTRKLPRVWRRPAGCKALSVGRKNFRLRAKDAYSQKTKISKREVSNPVYSGPVNLYTEDFLMSYFNNPNYRKIIKQDEEQYKQSLERKVSDTEDNTLPF